MGIWERNRVVTEREISNSGLGPGQRAPNSWTLTSSGQQVVSTIRAHSDGRRPESLER
jgi:hypothetical protein